MNPNTRKQKMEIRIKKCRGCSLPVAGGVLGVGTQGLDTVFTLGQQAFTGVFPKTKDEEVPIGTLELVKCRHCDLVQLGHSFDLDVIFGKSYGYRSGLNKSMVKHLWDICDKVQDIAKPKYGELVVDIGSNDGTLLNHYSQNLNRVGIDPLAKNFFEFYDHSIEIIPSFFPAKGVKNAKIITSISMFYDLENPTSFVKAINETLADDGIWCFEQAYLGSMLENSAFDNICHEHLEYYSLSTVHALLERTCMKIIDVSFSGTNGGSFMVIAAKNNSKYPITKLEPLYEKMKQEKIFKSLELYDKFSLQAMDARDKLKTLIASIKAEGKTVYGYGASSKGNVLLQYCGFTDKDITAMAEVNSDKFGSFTPGSKIPIIDEKIARAQKPDYMLVLPWHFKDMIIEKEADYLRSGGKLIFPLPELSVVHG